MSTEAKTLIGIGVATLAIVVGATFLVGGKTSPAAETKKLTEDQTKKLVREDSYVKGSKDAKVTIVEFGDFQCPACGAVHPIIGQLLTEYKDKVKFVYREYPLALHKNAGPAAQAAEAAGAQGKFYDMYDALFQNQKEWENSKNPMEQFEVYAKIIGLDVEKFKNDVESKKYEEKIQRDISDGNGVGVQATPTFFINGEEIRGGLPYDEFKAKIDAALEASK
jgi:protein-disulfide isomerase